MTEQAHSNINRWSGLSSKELLQLVDSSLGPTGSIWHRQRNQQWQRKPDLHGQSPANSKASSLAFQVGDLAKIGQFDDALSIMEGIAKQGNANKAFEQ